MSEAPASSDTSPLVHGKTDFRFPSNLGHFLRGATSDYESQHPGLGVGVTYEAPTCRGDIFVYNKGGEIPTGIVGAVESEFLAAIEGVLQQKREVVFLGRFTYPLNARRFDLPLLAADFLMPRGDGEMLLSSLILVGLRGHFIKVRLSHGGEGPRFAGFADAFMWELGGVLSGAVQEAASRFPQCGTTPRDSDDRPESDTAIRALYRQVSDLAQLARAWEWILYRQRLDQDVARATPPFFHGRSDADLDAELQVWQRYVDGQLASRREAVESMLVVIRNYYSRQGLVSQN